MVRPGSGCGRKAERCVGVANVAVGRRNVRSRSTAALGDVLVFWPKLLFATIGQIDS